MSVTTTYNVQGMTCDHCIRSVKAEVGKIEGVSDVQVDLTSGAVTVVSAAAIDGYVLKDAVEEAGYELAS